jgi:predicted CoA-binding protein
MSRQAIDSFFAEDRFAVLGVSRSGTKFGNMAFKELKDKGMTVYQVNPSADEIAGEPCYRSLSDLPEPVGAVLISVKSEKALEAVQEAHAAGIGKVWLQQGVKSPEAVAWAEENGMTVVHNRCIMMFAEPVGSIHKFHRFLAKIFGAYPQPANA